MGTGADLMWFNVARSLRVFVGSLFQAYGRDVGREELIDDQGESRR